MFPAPNAAAGAAWKRRSRHRMDNTVLKVEIVLDAMSIAKSNLTIGSSFTQLYTGTLWSYTQFADVYGM